MATRGAIVAAAAHPNRLNYPGSSRQHRPRPPWMAQRPLPTCGKMSRGAQHLEAPTTSGQQLPATPSMTTQIIDAHIDVCDCKTAVRVYKRRPVPRTSDGFPGVPPSSVEPHLIVLARTVYQYPGHASEHSLRCTKGVCRPTCVTPGTPMRTRGIVERKRETQSSMLKGRVSRLCLTGQEMLKRHHAGLHRAVPRARTTPREPCWLPDPCACHRSGWPGPGLRNYSACLVWHLSWVTRRLRRRTAIVHALGFCAAFRDQEDVNGWRTRRRRPNYEAGLDCPWRGLAHKRPFPPAKYESAGP